MKYADDIVNIMNDRGSINVPEDCTTGEEFDKWMHRANQGGRGMTREEAIELLDNLIGMVEDNHNSNYDTALQMAIKALLQETILDKVRAEIDKQEKWLLLLQTGYNAYNVEIAFSAIKSVLKESEVEE